MPLRERLALAHSALRTVCVTGTNGKTTTTSLIAAIVQASRERSARITTVGAWLDGVKIAQDHTPEAFATAVDRAVEAGVKTIAIETTSKALGVGFAHAWSAQVAVFTNLSRDHLDYHATPEQYLAAKAQLFITLPPGGVAVLNACDPVSALIAEVCPPDVKILGFAVDEPAPECAMIRVALQAASVEVRTDGTAVQLAPSALANSLGGRLALRVLGDVHVGNAMAAAVAAHVLGYSASAIVRGLQEFPGVPGRFEVVGREPLVVVDYAHTPDALVKSLQLARRFAGGGDVMVPVGAKDPARVICVFGCGGERDRGKRPEMGRAVAYGADVAVLTTDNPRGEDPSRIADDVMRGVEGGGARWVWEPDRTRAIRTAIAMAESPGDVVLIAGKGHETEQLLGDGMVPFSDGDVARAACLTRG